MLRNVLIIAFELKLASLSEVHSTDNEYFPQHVKAATLPVCMRSNISVLALA